MQCDYHQWFARWSYPTITFCWMLRSANDAIPVTFLTVDAGGAAAMLSPWVAGMCLCQWNVHTRCILNLNTPFVMLNCIGEGEVAPTHN